MMKIIPIDLEMIVKTLIFVSLIIFGRGVIADTYHIKKLIQNNQQSQQTGRRNAALRDIYIGSVVINLTDPDLSDHERFSYQPNIFTLDDNQFTALLDLFFKLISLPQTSGSTESSMDAAMSVLLGIFHHQAIHWRTLDDITRLQRIAQIQSFYDSYIGTPPRSRRGNSSKNRNRNRNRNNHQVQVEETPITFDNYLNPASSFSLDPNGLQRVNTGLMALMIAFFGPLLFPDQATFESHLLTATQALIVRVVQRAAGQSAFFNPSNPDFSHFNSPESFARFLRERNIANEILLALALKSFSQHLRAQSQPAENDSSQLLPDYQTVLDTQLPSNISGDIFISLFIAQLRTSNHSIQSSQVENPYDLGLWASRALNLGTLFFPIIFPILRTLNAPSARSLPDLLINGCTAVTPSSDIPPEVPSAENVPQGATSQSQTHADTTENNQNEPTSNREMFIEISAILMDIFSNMRMPGDPSEPEDRGKAAILNPNKNIQARRALFRNAMNSVAPGRQAENTRLSGARAYADIAAELTGGNGNRQGAVSNPPLEFNLQNIRAIHDIATRTRTAMTQDGTLMEDAPDEVHDFYSFLWGLAMPFVTLIPETSGQGPQGSGVRQHTMENAGESAPDNQEPVEELSQNSAQMALSEPGATAASRSEPITIPTNMCAICLEEDHRRLVLFPGCNHAVTCPECLEACERVRDRNRLPHTCPYCRRPYDNTDIYKPKNDTEGHKK